MIDGHTDEHLMATYRAVLELPFVAETGAGDDLSLTFWQTVPSGFADVDIARGEAYGRMAIETAKRLKTPMLIPNILNEIGCANAAITGLEAGFVRVVTEAKQSGDGWLVEPYRMKGLH